MKEAVKSGHQTGEKRTIQFSVLQQDEIDDAMSLLGPYQEMSLKEIRDMTAKKLAGKGLSEAIIEERREARY